jgi:SAM-dependent methyltransferase
LPAATRQRGRTVSPSDSGVSHQRFLNLPRKGKPISSIDTTLDYALHLPPRNAVDGLDQDEEWCEIEVEGERRRIRLHDYAEIFDVPGLYEQLFSERLACDSPRVVSELLADQLAVEGADPSTLTALDFGAGNGMVGERLDGLGIGTIVGVDLLEEARDAALRDRPGVYDDYRVLDLTNLELAERAELDAHGFDCFSCVAALGFGDVPPIAFAEALNCIADGGWVAFNVRDRFFEERDPTGFGGFLRRLFRDGVLDERARLRYTHRIAVDGASLDYLAVVSRKRRDVPMDWAAGA